MKRLQLIVMLSMVFFMVIGCAKQAAQNQNQAAATAKAPSTNTNTNTATTPAASPVNTSTTETGGGEVFTHEEGGIQFTVPKGWKAQPDGEQITVSTPDDSLNIVFWVPEEDSFDAAIKALDEELDKVIKDAKITSGPSQETLNGMNVYSASGTGAVEGTNILWSVDIIEARKPVIALSFAAPGLFEKHAASIEQFIKSIKRV